MPLIIPFMIGDTWFGLTLDYVKGIEATGKIALIPNAEKPLVGLMHKNNKIIPVWSITPTITNNQSNIFHRPYYIELLIDNQQLALPVDMVKSVTEISQGWVSSKAFGLTLYRSLAKNPDLDPENIVTEVNKEESSQSFYKDTSVESFYIEDIK
ncbi:MAG: chemotaxis protein CheW [Brevinema sp.]